MRRPLPDTGSWVEDKPLSLPASAFLEDIKDAIVPDDFDDIDNLDSGTSYSNDELRDKIIELINQMKA